MQKRDSYREDIGRARLAAGLMIAAVVAALAVPREAETYADLIVTDPVATATTGE